jgi:hypothetical protein
VIERSRVDACPSDLVLDARAAEELAANVVAQVEKHLAHCADCRAREAHFERSRAAFLRVAPTFAAQRKLVTGVMPGRARRGKAKPKAWTMGAAALFGLVAICVFAVLAMRPGREAPATHTRSASLGVLVERAGHITRGASGMQVQRGDWLRFTHTSDRDVYLALFHVDAHGAKLYFPETGDEARRIGAGTDVGLQITTRVDADFGTGRMVGVFCRAPFETAPLLAVLQASGALGDDRDCHVDELQLRSGTTP